MKDSDVDVFQFGFKKANSTANKVYMCLKGHLITIGIMADIFFIVYRF